MPKPPKLLVIALLILGGLGATVLYHLRSYDYPWRPALAIFDRERLFQVIRDNSHDLEKDKGFAGIQAGIEIKILRPFAAPELAIINFNTSRLCGAAGCLYSVYQKNKPDAPLFQWLLNPALPPATALFSISGDCLVVNQQSKKQIVTMKYCKSGDSYAERDKSFHDISTP